MESLNRCQIQTMNKILCIGAVSIIYLIVSTTSTLYKEPLSFCDVTPEELEPARQAALVRHNVFRCMHNAMHFFRLDDEVMNVFNTNFTLYV